MPVPMRGDQGADFFVAQHLVVARLLDVQNFAAQRQNRLIAAVAPLLRGAAGRFALHQEQFAALGIALLAIGELAGQAAGIERAFAARQFASFARGFAGARASIALAQIFFSPWDSCRKIRPAFR